MTKYKVVLNRNEDVIVTADDVLIDDQGHLHLISGDPEKPHHNGLFYRDEYEYAVEVEEE